MVGWFLHKTFILVGAWIDTFYNVLADKDFEEYCFRLV